MKYFKIAAYLLISFLNINSFSIDTVDTLAKVKSKYTIVVKDINDLKYFKDLFKTDKTGAIHYLKGGVLMGQMFAVSKGDIIKATDCIYENYRIVIYKNELFWAYQGDIEVF